MVIRQPTVTILEEGLTEREAIRKMHLYADKLRRRKIVHRYGVFYEKNRKHLADGTPLFRICLVDRKG